VIRDVIRSKDILFPTRRWKIVLVDWEKYDLYREKDFNGKKVPCGLGPFLENMSKLKGNKNVSITMVINAAMGCDPKLRSKYHKLVERTGLNVEVFFRENVARDIGAYDFGYKKALESNYEGDIAFMNSSVSGPFTDYWLNAFRKLHYSKENIGLTGTTLNMFPLIEDGKEIGCHKEHVQSWFLYSNMAVLKKAFGNSLLFQGADYKEKQALIENGEIGISQRVLDKGFGINCMSFPELSYFKGQTWPYPFRLGWRINNAELQKFINTTIV
tara:strand:- start:1139 stop:1951 length:813 start_codon:yes stop_codon:yes gene_type:complete